MDRKTTKIVCFGEVLWDILPSGNVAGGAPMNVAYHATQLGIPAQMISSIGRDLLGNKLICFLNHKGVDTTLIQTDLTNPTGTVNVSLDANDSPSYEIVAPVAWDYIHLDNMNKIAVENSDAFVYGSLSTRDKTSRNTLLKLLDLAKLKVLDVNLRSPYYNESLIMQLTNEAHIVKMNDEELEIIGKWMGISDTKVNTAIQIKRHFNLNQLIITLGANGAWLFDHSGMIKSPAATIEVQDTIGSGDSFLAAYLCKYLQKVSPEKCLEFATLTGAYVATKTGGTPEISEEHILELNEN